MGIKLPDQEVIFRREQNEWAKRSKKLVLDAVKRNLSGKVLKRKTGRTLRSLRSRLERTGPLTDGFSISIGTVAGVAWEGPKPIIIPARTITPTRRKALRFIGKRDGSVVFTRSVKMPRMTMKARPFLSTAFEEKRPILEKDYVTMMERIFKRSFPDLTIEVVLIR